MSPIWTPCANCGQPVKAADHDAGCPLTAARLVAKYGSEGKAAGAIALQIERLPGLAYMNLHDGLKSLVIYKQQSALLKLCAIAAGSSLNRLQREWRMREDAEQAAGGTEEIDVV